MSGLPLREVGRARRAFDGACGSRLATRHRRARATPTLTRGISSIPPKGEYVTTPALTIEELRALPPVIDLPTAARVLGIGRTVAYRLVRTGEWPTPVLRLGGTIRVPTAPLLALLGHTPAA